MRILATPILCCLTFQVVAAPLPALPDPRPVGISSRQAQDLLERMFGLECGESRIEGEFLHFVVKGFRDPRRTCPLEGLSGVRCGDLEFRPSEARIRWRAWNAPVSGHLAQNLVVALSLFSAEVPPSMGTLHGILVGDRPDPRKAVFGWYLGREARPLEVRFQDVNADGALDVLYTYEMSLGPLGRVVARDLWTFARLSPERVISSGDLLKGILTGTFEGLALWWDRVFDEVTRVRGAFRFEAVLPGVPALGLFERARTSREGPAMDLWVLGDFGEGWVLALSGSDRRSSGESHDALDCSVREVPPEAPLEIRRRMLELESVCRWVRSAMDPSPGPLVLLMGPLRAWVAVAARRLGFPVLALAVREGLARDLPDRGPAFWTLRAVLALADLSTIVTAIDSLRPGSSREERVADWSEALDHPLLVQAIRGVLGLWARIGSLGT